MSPRREPLPKLRVPPTPWEFLEEDAAVIDVDGKLICYMAFQGSPSPAGHLIAQSPTLYSLLESALPMLEAHSTPGFRAKVLMALAMARGENPKEVSRGQ